MIVQFFKRLWANDPVRSCEVYKDKENGSCAHVDGPLCDFPQCELRQCYLDRTKQVPSSFFTEKE